MTVCSALDAKALLTLAASLTLCWSRTVRGLWPCRDAVAAAAILITLSTVPHIRSEPLLAQIGPGWAHPRASAWASALGRRRLMASEERDRRSRLQTH